MHKKIKVILLDWVGVVYERNKGVFSSSENTIKTLRGRNYKIGLITQAGEGIKKRKEEIGSSDLKDLFNKISIVSSKDERQYRQIINSFNVNASECAVVDDQLPKLEKAKRIGCEVVWRKGSDRSHLLPDNKTWKPDLQIASIDELLEIF